MSDNNNDKIQNNKLNKTRSLKRLQPKRERFIFDDIVKETLKKSNSECLLSSLISNDYKNIHLSLPELKEFTYLPNDYELEYKFITSEIKSLYHQICYKIIQVILRNYHIKLSMII